MGKRIDETGKRYGRWTVLYYAGTDKNHRALWHCKCDCGNEKNVTGLMLRKGISKSCGCINKDRMASINNDKMTHSINIGDKFGHLTVIDIDSHNKVLCKCDCGQYKKTTRSSLYTGKTTTCGCKIGYKSYNFINEVGNKYGLLTVIEEVGRNPQGRVLWKCQCKCGNTTITTGKSLRGGYTSSCGCIISKGEAVITSLLQNHNINFKRQYSFDDLYINTGKARFDFAILDDNDCLLKLIEYNGYQHYDENEIWYNGSSDKKKREYCEQNHIELIEIPYTDFDILSWEYLKEKCNL